MNLRRLCKKFPTAANVFLFLLQRAGKQQSDFLIVTREQVARALGIGNLYTVSKAMAALRSEGLIKFKTGAKKRSGSITFRFYKISLGKDALTASIRFMFSQEKSAVIASITKVPSQGKGALTAPTLYKREPDGFASTPPPEKSLKRTVRTKQEMAAIFNGSTLQSSEIERHGNR